LDFFELGARRLRPGGLFVQWLQGYEISVDTYRTILATFHSVFAEVLAFKNPYGDDWYLVGSRQPLVLDLAALDQRWAARGIQAESERVGVRRIELLLSLLQLGPEGVRAFSQGVGLRGLPPAGGGSAPCPARRSPPRRRRGRRSPRAPWARGARRFVLS